MTKQAVFIVQLVEVSVQRQTPPIRPINIYHFFAQTNSNIHLPLTGVMNFFVIAKRIISWLDATHMGLHNQPSLPQIATSDAGVASCPHSSHEHVGSVGGIRHMTCDVYLERPVVGNQMAYHGVGGQVHTLGTRAERGWAGDNSMIILPSCGDTRNRLKLKRHAHVVLPVQDS